MRIAAHFRRLLLLVSICTPLLCCSEAQAAGFFGPDPDRAPSVFAYAFRGAGIGTLVGVSGAYLAARRGGWEREDWKALGYGAGFGALGGVALGLTLGFVDLADDNPGMAALTLRDMLLGAGLGALVGTIAGGLSVIGNEDAESLPFGAAIGTLSGTALGFVIGLIEGRRITDSPRHSRVQPLLLATRDSRERLTWMAGAGGRF